MHEQTIFLRSLLLVVFVLAGLALTACGPETLVVGLEPTLTVTPSPTPSCRATPTKHLASRFTIPKRGR